MSPSDARSKIQEKASREEASRIERKLIYISRYEDDLQFRGLVNTLLELKSRLQIPLEDLIDATILVEVIHEFKKGVESDSEGKEHTE